MINFFHFIINDNVIAEKTFDNRMFVKSLIKDRKSGIIEDDS